MSYTVKGIECSTMAEAIALRAAMMSQAPKATASARAPKPKKVPPTPRRPRARSFSSVNNRGLQAGVSYDFAQGFQDIKVESWVPQLAHRWDVQGIRVTKDVRRTNKKTGRLRLVNSAGSPYSLNSVRPWAFNAVTAIRAGLTRDQFIAAATAKGSKVGNKVGWKP